MNTTTYELWQNQFGRKPYEKTYTGIAPFDGNPMALLERLFTVFNIAHPADFNSYSLSVGDRVVLGESTFECASVGWEPADHPTITNERECHDHTSE